MLFIHNKELSMKKIVFMRKSLVREATILITLVSQKTEGSWIHRKMGAI